VSPRHQNAKYRQKSAIFGPNGQTNLKNAHPGCRRATPCDRKTAKICPKPQHLKPNLNIDPKKLLQPTLVQN
jgi:hypothetical protein